MTDTSANPEQPSDQTSDQAPAQPAAAPKVVQRVLAQYIRDMSFENVLVQKGLQGDLQPEISVGVNLDARKRNVENQYEVITKIKLTSKAKNGGETIFVLEVEYAGLFHVEGVPAEQLHPYLLIECPRITFPFLRRIVSDITRDGGFAPINLEPIDFVAIYRADIARRAQAQAAAAQPSGAI